MGLIVFLLVVVVVYLLYTVRQLSRRVEELSRAQHADSGRLDLVVQNMGSLHKGHSRTTASESAPPASTATTAVTPEPVRPRAIVPAPVTAFDSGPAAAEPAAPDESWEVSVATGWLNRIGVLVFVIGIALLVSYSFTRVGPAGRITIGYLASGALLAPGVLLEQRPGFRRYGYGLIAGGWAGIYFATFAMHGVPAARVIDSPAVATALLLAVSAGMIAHALRYQQPAASGLTFGVAYVTLAISPLTHFALGASLLLGLVLLAVSRRCGWPLLSLLGVVATYALYAWRTPTFGPAGIDPLGPLPYLFLGVAWLTFEVADSAARRATTPASPDIPLVWVNGAGVLLTMLMTVPDGAVHIRTTVLFAVAAAHLLSAWTRRTDAHAAVAIALVSCTGAILSGFSGDRRTLALLLQAQLVFTAGILLGDRRLRGYATLAAGVAGIHVWGDGVATGDGTLLAVVALVYYADQAVLHRRLAEVAPQDALFAWMGTLLASTAISLSAAPVWEGVAGLLLAVVLLEAGLRGSASVVWQAYACGAGWSYALVLAFTLTPDVEGAIGQGWGPAPAPFDEWRALLPAMALLTFAGWRLASGGHRIVAPQAPTAAAIAGVLAVALLVLFEWRVVPDRWLTAAWAASALLMAVGGILLRRRQVRLSGLALLGICLLKLFLVDASDLDAIARIMSFVALGAILLGISWTYTKYREELRKYL